MDYDDDFDPEDDPYYNMSEDVLDLDRDYAPEGEPMFDDFDSDNPGSGWLD